MTKSFKKIKKWTENELEKLKTYVQEHSELLVFIFYRNLLQKNKLNRKPKKFFQRLGKILRRTSDKCKSKFQKHEKIIFTHYLGIPEEHYSFYLEITSKESFSANFVLFHKRLKETINENGYNVNVLKEIRLQESVHLNNTERLSENNNPNSAEIKFNFFENVIHEMCIEKKNFVFSICEFEDQNQTEENSNSLFLSIEDEELSIIQNQNSQNYFI